MRSGRCRWRVTSAHTSWSSSSERAEGCVQRSLCSRRRMGRPWGQQNSRCKRAPFSGRLPGGPAAFTAADEVAQQVALRADVAGTEAGVDQVPCLGTGPGGVDDAGGTATPTHSSSALVGDGTVAGGVPWDPGSVGQDRNAGCSKACRCKPHGAEPIDRGGRPDGGHSGWGCSHR